ncbi:18383_t:CDS:2, partial [Acaulospora morrowiae]
EKKTKTKANEDKKEKAENKTRPEINTDAIRRLNMMLADNLNSEVTSKKRKAEEPAIEDKQSGSQVKDSGVSKVENKNQKHKKKKSESQHLSQSSNKNPEKTQNLDQPNSKDKNRKEKKDFKLTQSQEKDSSGSQEENKNAFDIDSTFEDEGTVGLGIFNKSLKRRNEQQVIESDSTKASKKQKKAASTQSEKQKTPTVETSSEEETNSAIEASSEKQKILDVGTSSEKVNGKKKKNDGNFEFSVTKIVKKIFKEGKHKEITLQQLEKKVIRKCFANPNNTLNLNELNQKFKENT